MDFNAIPLSQLFLDLVDHDAVRALLVLARQEDLGKVGDLTSQATLSENAVGRAEVMVRSDGVVAGLELVPMLLEIFGASHVRFEARTQDGLRCHRGESLATLEGSLREILGIERTLLNSLSRMCGVATVTRRFVEAVAKTRASICDTRKTIPGWRRLDKYAVRCGGGTMHRIGLFDAVLIKDNHLAGISLEQLPEFVRSAAARARSGQTPPQFIEVEVDSLEQLDRLLSLPEGTIDFILLDNMPLAMLADSVRQRNNGRSTVKLEASGGVSLANVADIAATGVERISVGALTHSVPALDLALDLS